MSATETKRRRAETFCCLTVPPHSSSAGISQISYQHLRYDELPIAMVVPVVVVTKAGAAGSSAKAKEPVKWEWECWELLVLFLVLFAHMLMTAVIAQLLGPHFTDKDFYWPAGRIDVDYKLALLTLFLVTVVCFGIERAAHVMGTPIPHNVCYSVLMQTLSLVVLLYTFTALIPCKHPHCGRGGDVSNEQPLILEPILSFLITVSVNAVVCRLMLWAQSRADAYVQRFIDI